MSGDASEHRQLFDLIERMLDYDPSDRIAMVDAIRHPYFAKLAAAAATTGAHPSDGESDSSRDRSHSISR
jgi:dual specificity protein kinase CLK2/3